jgi:hypothetical protein
MTSEGVAVNFAHLAHVYVFGLLRQGSEDKGKNFWCNNDIGVDNRFGTEPRDGSTANMLDADDI